MRTLEEIKEAVTRHVVACDNAQMLVEIEQMLEVEEEQPLLTLDEEDIRALLHDLLDE